MRKIDKFRVGRRVWNHYKKLFPSRTHILLATFPKSGSTYLLTLLSNINNISRVTLVTNYDRREQELSLERLIFLHHKNYVARHHTRFSKPTEQLISDFNLKPIVLVRNIFDIIESVIDHLHKEGLTMPMAYVPDDFLKWDRNFARNFIVDMMIPWYFNFYVSWYHYDEKLLVTYEKMIPNTFDTLKEIVSFCNIHATSRDIENSIDNATNQSTRKNVGRSGRGDSLPDDVKEKIYNMTKFYPNVDFSTIGL